MEITGFRHSSIFILLGLLVIATNAKLNNLLSEELIEECRQHGGNINGVQRCLKIQMKEFCSNNDNGIIEETEKLFCNMMQNKKRKITVGRRHHGIIPLSVKQKCREREEINDEHESEDCIQEELEAYCEGLELNTTRTEDEQVPYICSCYKEQGRRNVKQCITEQKLQSCEEQDEPTFECKKIKKCGGAGNKRSRQKCIKNLCNEEDNLEEFECKKMECSQNSNNRKTKRQCIRNLCMEDSSADEFLCLKLKEKKTWRIQKKMQQVGKPWKHTKSPIPKIVKKLCRDESAEEKDDCIFRKLEQACKSTDEMYEDNKPTACKCIGNTNYTETIDGLKSCVKAHMLDYCQDEKDDIERSFECEKLKQCGSVERRHEKKQCIKKLCEEDEFADSCHCKKQRRERRKCFRAIEEKDHAEK